jgi:predicted nucleic acid-binding Zn ribbon protein
VGHSQSPRALVPGQLCGSRRWHPDCRRCLLKGCERWFLPHRVQGRYCSEVCQQAARRWRRWLASQRYRATGNGQQHRRDQARRYRSRLRQESSLTEPTPPGDHVELTCSVVEGVTSPGSEPPPIVGTTGEGQRREKMSDESCGLPCHRPGCYVLFLPSARSPDRKFCSGSCRQALRRVRQRERRLRKRRQRGIFPRFVHYRRPP